MECLCLNNKIWEGKGGEGCYIYSIHRSACLLQLVMLTLTSVDSIGEIFTWETLLLFISSLIFATLEETLLWICLWYFYFRNIAFNPWKCDCALKPFRDYLVKFMSLNRQLLNQQNVSCSSSPEKSFLDPGEDKFWCMLFSVFLRLYTKMHLTFVDIILDVLM